MIKKIWFPGHSMISSCHVINTIGEKAAHMPDEAIGTSVKKTV